MANIIGVCGKIGSGKSTLLDYLQYIKYDCLNTDIYLNSLCDDISNPYCMEIKEYFGNSVVNKDKTSLNRTMVVSLAFSNVSILREVNAIQYFYIRQKINELVQNGIKVLFVERSSIGNNDLDFNNIIEVSAHKNICIGRAMARSNSPYERIARIYDIQSFDKNSLHAFLCDSRVGLFTIMNNDDQNTFLKSIPNFVESILKNGA